MPRFTTLRFTKAHGAGNDFAILRDPPPELTPARIADLADRRTGIGFDQLIALHPATHPHAAILMRIHNADGTPAGACGNATRCVALLLARQTGAASLTIQTPSGLLPATILSPTLVRIDMGPPALTWRDVPLAARHDTLHLPLPGDPAALSMGNPHATLFVPDLDAIDPAQAGPPLEHDPIFPDRANIGFAQILAADRIRLRVWERGAGLTRACGSGACAALVNAHRRGLVAREATLILDGGTLRIVWREADGHVLMTGPAATTFTGEVDLSTTPP